MSWKQSPITSQPKPKILQKIPMDLDHNTLFCQIVLLIPSKKT